jgi:beta-lactamase regulating signal transducer with metallopeptidase domain
MNADTLLHWLLRTSLEASLLILAVLGLRLMLGTRLSPAWRIGLWMLVGAKLMLPAFIPAGFGLGGWFHEGAGGPSTHAAAKVMGAAADFVFPADSGNPQIISELKIGGFPESAGILSGYAGVLCLWLVGACWVMAAALYRQRRFDLAQSRRPCGTAPLLRALVAGLSQQVGLKKAVRVVLMPAGSTPAVVGIGQPSVLLPEDWETRFDERSLRHVLLHELLHVKLHDVVWNWAATAVQALHWFNPLVWFVVSRFQADRELRCDAGALALLSPTERLDYGHTLLRIQASFFAPPALAGLAPCVRNHPTLRHRIHMIAHPTTHQPVLQCLLVLTLCVLVGYSFTTARAVEKEVPAKERTREGSRTPAAGMTELGSSQQSNRIVAIVDGEPIASSEVQKAVKADGGKHNEQEMLEIMIKDKIAKIQSSNPAKQPTVRYFKESSKSDAGTSARSRDGDGGTRKPSMGDDEGARKPGMRDGEKPRTGARDGDGGAKKTGARDGDRATSSSEIITLRVEERGVCDGGQGGGDCESSARSPEYFFTGSSWSQSRRHG